MSDASYITMWKTEAIEMAEQLAEHGDHGCEIFFPVLFSKLQELMPDQEYEQVSNMLIRDLLAQRGVNLIP